MSLINNLLNSLDRQTPLETNSVFTSGMQVVERERRVLPAVLFVLCMMLSFAALYYSLSWQSEPAPVRTWQSSVPRTLPEPPRPRVTAEKPVEPKEPAQPVVHQPAGVHVKPDSSQPIAAMARKPAEAAPAQSAKLAIVAKPETRQKRLWRAIAVLLDKGNWHQAETELVKFLQEFPADIDARLRLLELLSARQHWMPALQLVNEGLQLEQHQSLILWQGRILVELQRFAEAIQLLEALAVKTEASEEISALIGGSYQQLNKHANAIEWYNKALKANPANSRWWLAVAISSEVEQQFARARQAYEQVLADQAIDTELKNYARQRLAALP